MQDGKKLYGTELIRSIYEAGQGWTAAKPGGKRFAAVEACIDDGAEVNEISEDSRLTALHHAAMQGNIELMRLLIQKGARIDMCSLKPDGTFEYYSALSMIANNREGVFDLLKEFKKVKPLYILSDVFWDEIEGILDVGNVRDHYERDKFTQYTLKIVKGINLHNLDSGGGASAKGGASGAARS